VSRTKIKLPDSYYQDAAEIALFGKLPVPPAVNPATCEAYLIELAEPTFDYFERGEYTHVVAIVSRGSLGSFVETITVFASDDQGTIIMHGEYDAWVNMLDGGVTPTHYGDATLDSVLAAEGINVR